MVSFLAHATIHSFLLSSNILSVSFKHIVEFRVSRVTKMVKSLSCISPLADEMIREVDPFSFLDKLPNKFSNDDLFIINIKVKKVIEK